MAVARLGFSSCFSSSRDNVRLWKKSLTCRALDSPVCERGRRLRWEAELRSRGSEPRPRASRPAHAPPTPRPLTCAASP